MGNCSGSFHSPPPPPDPNDRNSIIEEFTIANLRRATEKFRSSNLLGEGRFGRVYKGWIHGKTGNVAVKIVNSETKEHCQTKINFLGRLSHPNLVKLIGSCQEDNKLLIVYEFMQKGNLSNHLFGRGACINPLSWNLRLRIAIQVALGLSFLHASDTESIYTVFKTSNILLDGKYNAKISDLGLVILGLQTLNRTTVVYVAPECITGDVLNVKSHIYGFGVVLLELMTGKRAFDRPDGQQNLVEWMKSTLISQKNKVESIMDVRVKGQYRSEAIILAAKLALRCVDLDHSKRPCMEEVVEKLLEIDAIKKIANVND